MKVGIGTSEVHRSFVVWCSILIVAVVPALSSFELSKNVYHVKPSMTLNINTSGELNIFCRLGEKKILTNYFLSATLRILSTAEDIKLIRGFSAADVHDKYVHSTKWMLWAANLLPWRVREANFPTFNSSCVGVITSKPYSAMLVIRPVDKYNFSILMAGLAIFFLAPRLTKSTVFFYTSGTLFGAVAAILILLFIITRFMPKGKSSYLTVTVLWTLCVYFAGEMWNHFEEILHEKLPYILVYLTSGALISFIVCYRLGPPSHPKTVDIIKWSLQTCGLVLIHLSSDLVEVSTAIIAATVFYHAFYPRIKYFAETQWRRRFPPKVKLLSEEEYITQGTRETEKGLEELRKFCSSPDCNSWKLVSRLKNPLRFSSFIQGESHLSDEEMMDYDEQGDSSMEEENPGGANDFYTDDDDSISINGNGNGNNNSSQFHTDDED